MREPSAAFAADLDGALVEPAEPALELSSAPMPVLDWTFDGSIRQEHLMDRSMEAFDGTRDGTFDGMVDEMIDGAFDGSFDGTL